MKYFNHFAPIIILALSCTSPQLGKQAVNLETFDLNFDVNKFYAPSLEKAKLYGEQRDAILSGKDEKEFGDKLVDPWSFETIAIDSVFVDDIFAPVKQLVGLQYNMKSHTLEDSLALYGNMHFEGLNMMRREDGEFMALVASNQNEGPGPFQQLLADIEKKHGKAKVSNEDFFGGYKVYSWQLADRLLAISSKNNDKSNELKLALDLDSMTVDTTKHPSIDTKLFIVTNSSKDSVMGNLKSGEWLYFDKLLEN
ncbi:MAG TPA: hypothetical protein VN040_14945 [Pseudosphingobacterium sp.]|nr:hypothetical protein [Pseudosphingobacterium sp.]